MKKILIVKLAAIGDVVMSLTMLTAIKEQYGNCSITWVCGEMVVPILQQFAIENIITVNEHKLLTGNFATKVWEILKLWRKLIFHNYDIVITAHGDKRYRLLTWPVLAGERNGFGLINGEKIPYPGCYHGDEYARLITEQKRSEARHYAPPIFANSENIGTLSDSYFVILAPGGAKNVMRDDACRRWPIASYVALAQELLKSGYTVAVTGAISDRWIQPYFAGMQIKDYVGKTDLLSMLNLFRRAGVVVTHDSGPMHLAILSGTKVVALFGPTAPSEKVPVSNKVKVLWKNASLDCCPCYDGKNYAVCKNNLCMQRIRVADVLTAIHEFEQD